MTELIFTFIIFSLLVAFILFVLEEKKERAKLINALISKTPEQYRDMTLADKVILTPPVETQPDIVPFEGLTDDEFDEHIERMNNA